MPGDYHSSGPLDCSGTCGNAPFTIYLLFYLFYAMAAFVLFQLVIGVLMDIYLQVQQEMVTPPACPGCGSLTVPVLKRIHMRWLLNARVKDAMNASGRRDPLLVKRAASMRRLWSSPNRIVPSDGTGFLAQDTNARTAGVSDVAAPS